MKILLCSTYYGFPCLPDAGYGGMEKQAWFLARELVNMGHDVTLVGGPKTELDGATILNYDGGVDSFVRLVRENVKKWDVVHDSSHDHPISSSLKDVIPCISTVHNPNPPGDAPNAVTLSKFHQIYTKQNYNRESRVVYNGVPQDYYPFYPQKDDYVALIGVMESRKGVLESIRGAKSIGVPIRLAGLSSQSKDYQRIVDSHIDGKNVTWHGQISGHEKREFMGRARALMLYVQWAEPGSFVGPESTALGTPLVVNNVACVSEYVESGVTGVVVSSPNDIGEAIKKCWNLDPSKVHDRWARIFNAERMAREYVELYQRVLDGESW